jgi:hypothetical protein
MFAIRQNHPRQRFDTPGKTRLLVIALNRAGPEGDVVLFHLFIERILGGGQLSTSERLTLIKPPPISYR